MVKKNIEAIYPLSPMQNALLLHNFQRGCSEAGFLQNCYLLAGKLDIAVFQRAWQRVVERHPVLRTSFYWENLDQPLQIVHQKVELPWQQEDWRTISPQVQQENLDDFLKADRAQGFNLSQAPLMRFSAFQISEERFRFTWSFHHLLLDGWSSALVNKEVFAFYNTFCRGQDKNIPSPPPYRDYIRWLRQQDVSDAKKFWRTLLKELPDPLVLEDRNKNGKIPDQSLKYYRQQLQLTSISTSNLTSFLRQNRITLNLLLSGIWAIVLNQLSSKKDVIFGTTVSGRSADLPKVETMVGLFINILPVRAKISTNTTFIELSETLQEQQAEAHAYQYCSLPEIHNWNELPGNQPLFESLLIVENYPVDDILANSDSQLKLLEFKGDITSTYPLTIVVIPGRELQLQLYYDGSSFDETFAANILRHIQDLINAVIKNPGCLISELPSLKRSFPGTNGHFSENSYQKTCHQVFPETIEKPGSPERPLTPQEQAMMAQWKKVLGVGNIGIHDNFFELGGNSLTTARLISEIKDSLNISIPLQTLFKEPTISGLANHISHIHEQTGSESNTWQSLLPIQPLGSRQPFFIVAGAPDEAVFLRYISNLLPFIGFDQPVYGFKARGLDGQKAPHQNVEEMAAAYIKELQAFQPQGPYLLGGECMGGIVAYEMAQQLQANGQQVALLVLMDTIRPMALSAFLVRTLPAFNIPRRFERWRSRIKAHHEFTPGEKLCWVSQAAKRKVRKRFPVRNSASPGEKVSRHFESRYPKLLYQYRPKKYPGQLILIVNQADYRRFPTLGWKNLAEEGVVVHIVPGNHITRLTTHAQKTGRQLRECLDAALSVESETGIKQGNSL